MNIDFSPFPYLPKEYIDFVNGLKKEIRITDKKSKAEWRFYPSKPYKSSINKNTWSLFTEIKVDNQTVPVYQDAAALIRSVSTYADQNFVNKIKKLNLNSTFTIAGVDSNCLFINEDGSLWAFWLSSQELEKVSNDFSSWIKKNYAPVKTNLNAPTQIFGTWKPISTLDGNIELEPQVIIKSDGIFQKKYDDGDVVTSTWNYKTNKSLMYLLIDTDSFGIVKREIIIDDENTITIIPANPDFKTTYKRVET